MAILDDIIAGRAEEFNALRETYFPPDSVLKLLKASETTDEFVEIAVLATDWYLTYSKFRQRFELSIARNSADFTAQMRETQYVAINGDVFTVVEADTVPPVGAEPVWKLACERFVRKTQFSSIY